MAVRLANIAAGVVVGEIGTAVAREADLLAALSPQGGALRKIVSRDAAVEHVQRWHHKGWRVGSRMAASSRCSPLTYTGWRRRAKPAIGWWSG